MSMTYPIPTELSHAEIEIKKSRFIAYARGVKTREEGLIWLEEIRTQYPDARWNCNTKPDTKINYLPLTG